MQGGLKDAHFIAKGLHSYSIVEENGFLDLIAAAAPEYVVPSTTTFSRSVITILYEEEVRRVKYELKSHFNGGTECYSITTDGWTSRSGDSYLSLTCHILDGNFAIHNYTLACRCMPLGHSADNIRNFLKDVIAQWDLPESVPVFMLTDNARNFVAAIPQCGSWTSIPCFAHTLQLSIEDAKKQTAGFNDMCGKARSLVGHYKRSAQARHRLQQIQETMGTKPLE
ncbi:zinc finger BED domain-containing protein 4-like [Ornithodoros turicata]|uniref:zinc finger BED domain-containing protein 4-like n=1 Tax=Ornithodoros turicata TaxID=34597 RepID=UPI003139E1D2